MLRRALRGLCGFLLALGFALALEYHVALKRSHPLVRVAGVHVAQRKEMRGVFATVLALAVHQEGARMERTTVDIASDDGQVELRATGQVVLFDGFLRVYEEGRDDDVTEDDYICNSTFTCFWYIFFVGVPAGTISDLMTEVTVYDGEEYWSRVAYDLIFFVWMGVLLFNVITGLMVDTFGSLREESNERESTLSNSCFICGVS